MARLTKKQKTVVSKVDANKQYSLLDASKLVKEVNYTKFDASVDVAVRLGVDPRKANQMVRGIVTLPHGTGKTIKVLVLCTPDKEKEARDAGAAEVQPAAPGCRAGLSLRRPDAANLERPHRRGED